MLNKYLKILALLLGTIALIEIINASSIGGVQEVRVNVLPEFLLVNSPASMITYNNSIVDVNVTLDVLGSKVDFIKWSFDKHSWKTLCTDCDEYGLFKKKNKAFGEGEQELEFRLIGSRNQIIQQKTVKFNIDTKKPAISKTSPSNGEATNGNGFYIKYSEENLKEITLVIQNKKITKTNKECPSGNREECFFDVDLSKYNNQWIEYQFKVSDYASTEDSKKIPVFVDVDSPELTINSPQSGYYNLRIIPFNITSNEYSTFEYMDLSEKNPRWKKLCSKCSDYGLFKKSTEYFRNGVHNLLIKATDTAGNEASQVVVISVKSKSFLF